MKEGWKYVTLKELCRVQNGFAFDSKQFGTKGVPLVRIRDIKRGYSETYTTEIADDAYEIKDGDILIGMDGDFNIAEWKGGNALLNQRVCKLVPSDKLYPRFALYFLPKALTEINSKTAFSTVKHLSSKQVNEINIPELPLSEQQRIVSQLDSSFAKIDALKTNAGKMLDEAKALFASALREAMKPKEGWEEKKLGEVCQRISDGSHNPPKGEIFSTYKMLSSKNVRADKFTFDNPRYLSENDFIKENQRTNVEKGDVLLTIVGAGLGDCCQYPCEEKVVFQRSVAVIKTEKHFLDSRYLMFYLQNEYHNLAKESNGAAQKGIYLNQLKKYSIPLPPLPEQSRIVSHLDNLSAKVRQLEANFKKVSEECDALKQAILRETFE